MRVLSTIDSSARPVQEGGAGFRFTRRTLLSIAMAAPALCAVRRGGAEGVPFRSQARLVAKVAEYDRNLVARDGLRVVLLIRRAGNAEAAKAVEEVASELRRIERIAGGPHREIIEDFDSPASLRAAVEARGASIVYLAELGAQVGAVARALDGATVLTTAPTGSDAERGSVVGFDIVSGRAQLVVNLPQAKRQNVAFRPEFLRLARVIR